MQFSLKGLNLLAEWEGEVDHIYKDAGGKPTIGIGHLIVAGDPDFSHSITHDEATALLDGDIEPAETCVNNHVTVTLNQDQFDALVSFTFNCGTGAFQSSTLLKKVNASLFDQVPDQLMLWVHVNGKFDDGLFNRRTNECKLWKSQI